MSQKVNSDDTHFIDDAIYLDVEISCENFESEINEVLDRRQSPEGDRRLVEHAAECEACREIFREYVLVDDSLKLCRGDIERMIAEGANESAPAFRYHAIGILSSIALLVLMGLLLIPRPNDRYRSNLAMNSPDAILAAIAEEVEGVNRASSEDQAATEIVSVSKPSGTFTPESHRKLVNFFVQPFQQLNSSGRGYDITTSYFAEPRAQLATFGNEFGSHLQNAFSEYTSELKVVSPVGGSVGLTLEILRTLSSGRFLKKQTPSLDPDLGRFFSSETMLVSV